MNYTNFIEFSRAHKGIAAILIAAFLMWASGLPMMLQTAEAAALQNVSDVLSDSDKGVVSNHTFTFTLSTSILPSETITITWPGAFTVPGTMAFDDIDLADDGVDVALLAAPAGASWGAAFAGNVLTLQSGTAGMATGSVVTVEVGTNATFGTAGDEQITNPSPLTPTSYVLNIGGTMSDAADLRVAIIDDVLVTATVETTLQFTISGLNQLDTVNGDVMTGTTTATSVPFGVLNVGSNHILGQELNVTTNAANGFSVTVEADQTLSSATGADIDTFVDSGSNSTPISWVSPAGTFGNENTYGHWGLTSEDSTVSSSTAPDEYGAQLYVGNFVNTPREVFYHNAPADGSTADAGQTRVAYQVEINALQEAASDYSATLTYVATPVF